MSDDAQTLPPRSPTRIVRGIGASPGISIAPALTLEATESTVFRVAIKPADVAAEARRFRDAVETAKSQLRQLQEVFEQEHRETAGSIFEAQMLVLEDERLMGGTEDAIRGQRINAEWALRMELHH